jgi:hypothetical protein
VEKTQLLKLDLGSGAKKKAGFLGVDRRQFDGVDQVADLVQPWPWPDCSVEEAHCAHFLEHLEGEERIHFANELWRVLVPGGKCTVVTPNWASARAYGDLTHRWPPVTEWWFPYLNRAWRSENAAHDERYTCDFDFRIAYAMDPEVAKQNPQYQQHALKFFKEAAADIVTTLEARKPGA